MNDKTSVSKLIQGVREGDVAAQQQLYDKYFKTLRIWAQSNQKKLGTRNDIDSPSDIAIKVLKSIMMRAERGRRETTRNA